MSPAKKLATGLEYIQTHLEGLPIQVKLTQSGSVVNDGTMLISTLESTDNQELFAIVESLATSKNTTSKGKSSSCAPITQKPKSSKTSAVALTSKEKGLFPFWNDQCQATSRMLWLPTVTDLHGSGMNSSGTSLSATGAGSWFSVNHHLAQKLNYQKTCSILSTSLVAGCTDLEVTKSKLVKLSVTASQKKLMEQWIDTARYVYNQALGFLRDYDASWEGIDARPHDGFVGAMPWVKARKPSWMDIKKMFTRTLPDWTKSTPFQIKGMAVKQAHEAFWKTCKANKGSGKPTLFNFKSRKEPEQSIFIPKTAIGTDGIYPTISGKGLHFCEPLPESFLDSRLISRWGEFYLMLPYKTTLKSAENQGRVVAIDPGVRKFATYFSDDSCGFIGSGDFARIQRIAFSLDDLISRASKANKQTKRAMMKAASKVRKKIRHLIEELHHKTAMFFVKNYDVILLPTFETKQMVGKSGRKIRSKTVRSLLTFSHYKFKLFLKHKAFEYGKKVIDVCEAYTSKTHPETGELKNVGAAKKIRLTNGSWVDRDIVGARNILLRALVDSPDSLTVAVG